MSDRPDLLERELAGLADDVAHRAHAPDFGAVEARVTRRRRSTRLALAGSAFVAVAVVTALVVAPGLSEVREPAPAPATDAPAVVEPGTVRGVVQQLVEDERAHRFEVAGGLDGSVAVIWRNLVQPEPTFALLTRSADGVVTGQLLDSPFDLTAVPGGWVGTSNARHYIVRPDGRISDLPMSDGAVEAAAGDVVVPHAQGFAVYRDGRLRPSRIAPDIPAALITSDGELVTSGAVAQVESSAGGQVTLEGGVGGITLTGNGAHVAAIGIGDEPDGGLPVVAAAISADSGATWREVDLPADFGEITSAAVTDGGTTVLATYGASARFLTPDGTLVTPPKPLVFEQVASAGEVVYGWTNDELFVSNDADLDELWVRVDGSTLL